MRRAVAGLLARGLDELVLWRLGLIPFAVPTDLDLSAIDPGDFWSRSRVLDPAPVHIARELGRHRRTPVRLVDLEAPSFGSAGRVDQERLVARAHLLEARDTAPLVLILHGFAVPAPIYDERHARRLAAAGAHAVRLDLPFHLRRRSGSGGSGAGFFGADLAVVRSSIRQSVEDAAAIVSWARDSLGCRVAVLGFSLGGLIALLLAALVQVDAVVAVAPLCDPARTFHERLPRRARQRLGLMAGSGGIWGRDHAAAGEALRRTLAPVVPRCLHPISAGGSMVLVVAGRDFIVGNEPVRELAQLWRAELWEYPDHGHLSVLAAAGLSARIHRHLMGGHAVRAAA